MEYDFTADLENDLDAVSEGKIEWKSLLRNFWDGFNENVEKVSEKKITEVISSLEKTLEYHLFGDKKENRICPSCSTGTLELKLGKFGAFLACNRYPDCKFRKAVVSNVDNTEDSSTFEEDKLLGKDKNGFDIFLKKGPYGFYIQSTEQVSNSQKPRRASLPATIKPDEITLDLALKLLALPFKIGKHPSNGEEIIVGIGRYGPYLKYLEKFISIPKKYNPFNITIDMAVEIIDASHNKPKRTSKNK